MKKLIALSAIVAASLANAALSDAEVLSMFQNAKDSGVEVKVLNRAKLAGNIERITIEFTKGDESQKQVIFSDGSYLFPDVIDVKNKISYAGKFDQEQEKIAMQAGYKKLAQLLKTLDTSKIISIGSDASKPTTYVFTDPLCPYCREALKHVEENLKETNLKVIFAPIPSHGDDAVAKSIAIQDEAKKAKSDADKIAIMKKYYAENAKAPKVDDSKMKSEKALIEKIFQTGAIRGVPAFIDAKDLK